MKYIKYLILILPVFMALFLAAGIYADFEDTGSGARAVSMGNAFTAISDDPFGIYYNPAGLSKISGVEVSCEYGRLFTGLDDNSGLVNGTLIYIQPLRAYGTFGAALQNFGLVSRYQENILVLSYSRKINKFLSLGASAKTLYQWIAKDIYTLNDPVFDYGRKDSVLNFSFDFGLQYLYRQNITAAVLFKDINQPDMGFAQESKIPLNLKLGLAYSENLYNLALDASFRGGYYSLYAGGEKWFNGLKDFVIRGGGGIGSDGFLNISLGTGYNFLESLSLDYSVTFPISGLGDLTGSHRLALTYLFPVKYTGEIEDKREIIKNEKTINELKNKISSLEKNLDEAKKTEDQMKEKEEIEKLEYEKRKLNEELKKHEDIQTKIIIKPAKITRPCAHTVSEGETIRAIALKYYGDEKCWIDIYNANKDKVKRGRVTPGDVLTIP